MQESNSALSAAETTSLLRWPRAFFSCRHDPRFSFCVAIPEEFGDEPNGHRLVVAIHGSSRGAMAHRDALVDFSKRERCVVLAPMFPIGPRGDNHADGYKYLIEGDLRYDTILLAMIDQLQTDLRCDFGRFLLTGYSGGGHFVHRFLYLHPERLAAASIGAPGAITRIDPTHDYWLGTRNWEAVFGKPIDSTALRAVPIQLLVGALDIQDLGFGKFREPSSEQIAHFGRSRVDRSNLLRANYEALGLDVTQQILPGIAHEGLRTIPAVEQFFESVLGGERSAPAQHVGGSR